jgi:hypothetical protein
LFLGLLSATTRRETVVSPECPCFAGLALEVSNSIAGYCRELNSFYLKILKKLNILRLGYILPNRLQNWGNRKDQIKAFCAKQTQYFGLLWETISSFSANVR